MQKCDFRLDSANVICDDSATPEIIALVRRVRMSFERIISGRFGSLKFRAAIRWSSTYSRFNAKILTDAYTISCAYSHWNPDYGSSICISMPPIPELISADGIAEITTLCLQMCDLYAAQLEDAMRAHEARVIMHETRQQEARDVMEGAT